MRDTKKEKELRFSMPVSLSQTCKKPLLEGRRVLITQNSKPSTELLKCLVRAAGGKLLERNTVLTIKNKNLEGAFVISCEQDCNICLPFIKNGFGIFDSELLLNGIIVQKLEFERAFLEVMFTNRKERAEVLEGMVVSNKDATVSVSPQKILLL